MRGRQSENWTVNEERFRRWLGPRHNLLSPVVDLKKPSVKTLAALALLDGNSRQMTYGEISEAIYERKIVQPIRHSDEEGISILTLRVALSELGRTLADKKHRFQLRVIRENRTARFQLLQPYQTEVFSNLAPASSPTHHRDPINDPRTIAKTLVQNGGGIPIASLYATYRAAAAWLSFSTKTAVEKKSYESGSMNTLGVTTRIGGDRVSLVGLAVGEGLGEIEILKDLLRNKARKHPLRVDYLAIDSSDILLMSHAKLVTEHFSKEINDGSLVFVPVVGDLYELSQHKARESGLRGNGFLSSKYAITTFFGNCLGNDEQKEWEFFKKVFEAFQDGEQVEVLVGVSLIRYRADKHRRIPIDEKYTLDPFLLETPRHLTYDLEFLTSLNKTGKAIPLHQNTEFLLPEGHQEFLPSADYATPMGVRGKVYRFFYKLKNDLTTWDRDAILKAGQPILLYSIVKYEVETLLEFLRARGYSVSAPQSESGILSIAEGEEEFRYMVFSVLRPARSK